MNGKSKFGRQWVVSLAALGTVAHAGSADLDPSKLPPPAAVQVSYVRDIRPILESSCLRCHGPIKPKSHFRLDNRASALKGGDEGIDIVGRDSAKSPLVYYTARLVPDMEMPPEGKGEPLDSNQVALLRAWIDQGASWPADSVASAPYGSISTTLGGTALSGDNHKFRELNWQKEGLNGGISHFDSTEQLSPGTKAVFSGHVLVDDYKLALAIDSRDLGYIRGGWEQYRKYYDTFGGYDPVTSLMPADVDTDLHLNVGRAWVDLGLTLPNWPRMALGYEYDYRQGDEATLDWGPLGAGINSRNLAPDSQYLDEGRQVLKFDLQGEFHDVTVEDQFRGEFYKLNTHYTNTVAYLTVGSISPPLSYSAVRVDEGAGYFQGANMLRAEKKVTDWLMTSAGYLYSKLNADSSFSLDSRTLPGYPDVGDEQWRAPEITLEQESDVGNFNALFGPWDGLTVSTSAQGEYTRQTGLGDATIDETILPAPFTNTPTILASSYDESSFQEVAGLRYGKIPFTALFADMRLEQQSIKQSELLSATDNISRPGLAETTDFSREITDLRAGFNTSPWRAISFSADYHHDDDNNHYRNGPFLTPPGGTSYPGFINARDESLDAAETKLTLRPWNKFSAMFSYQYQSINYMNATAATVPPTLSPGGSLLSGQYFSHNFSLNTSFTPIPPLFLSATFSYQRPTMVSASDGSSAIVPYRGDIYSVVGHGTFILNRNMNLLAGYEFSTAAYGENNFSDGVPVGIDYHQENAHFGVSRRFGTNLLAKLEYRFYGYHEPTSGGAANYNAHMVFLTMAYSWR